MIMYLLIIGSAFFVYSDASKHKIGKIPEEKGLFNNSAGMWTIGTLLLWIVFFPSYLIKRSELITKAKEKPQEPSSSNGAWLGIIGIVFVIFLLTSLSAPRDNMQLVKKGVLAQRGNVALVKSNNKGASASNPSKNFLSSKIGDIFGVPQGTPYTVNEFVNIGMRKDSKKIWEKVSDDTWVLTVSLKDVMTGQVNSLKFLMKQNNNVVVIQRIVTNGENFPQGLFPNLLVPIWEKIEKQKQK